MRKNQVLAFIGAVLFAGTVTGCGADAQKTAGSDPAPPAAAMPVVLNTCDRIAANPKDNLRVGEPVMYYELDAERAVDACNAAIAEFPNEPRYPYLLARAVEKGNRGLVGWNESIALYEMAANAGYASAKVNFADMLTRRLDDNLEQAELIEKLLKEALSQGNNYALITLGDYHEKRGNKHDHGSAEREAEHAQAQAAWKEALDAGLVEGALKLAYFDRIGGGKLYQSSVKTAAMMGHAESMVELGVLYSKGRSLMDGYHTVPVDKAESKRWLAAAQVEEENYLAMMLLARISGTHREGWGNGRYLPVNFELRDQAWRLAGREDLIAKYSRSSAIPVNSVGNLSKGSLLCETYKSALRAGVIASSGNHYVNAASSDCDYAPNDLHLTSVQDLEGGVSKVVLSDDGRPWYTAELINY